MVVTVMIDGQGATIFIPNIAYIVWQKRDIAYSVTARVYMVNGNYLSLDASEAKILKEAIDKFAQQQ